MVADLEELETMDASDIYSKRLNAKEVFAKCRTIQRTNNPLGAMVEYHPISPRDQSRLHQFGKQRLLGIFLGYEIIAEEIRKGDSLIAGLEDLKKLDASEIYPRRIKAKEVLISLKRWWIHLPNSRWDSKIVRKRPRFPRTHSKAGKNRKEWKSEWRTSRRIGRVSTNRIYRWRWSPCRLLVDPSWLHLSSSQWTSSSTPCAERWILPYPTGIQCVTVCHSVSQYVTVCHSESLCVTVCGSVWQCVTVCESVRVWSARVCESVRFGWMTKVRHLQGNPSSPRARLCG